MGTGETMDKPVCANKGGIEVELVEGKTYDWCLCGRSTKQPFCDGSHSCTELRPWKFKATKSAKISLCGCKRTKSPPFCDDSHETIEGHLV